MFQLFKIHTVGLVAYSLLLTTSVRSGLELSSQAMNHEVPRYGIYRIHGRTPKGFEGFYEFELTPPSVSSRDSDKADGKLVIGGALFVRPFGFKSRVQTEPRGELSVDGAFSVVNVVRLKFKSATLIQQAASSTLLEFETETIQEVHYVFKGAFIDGFLLPGGPYISLKGTLIRVNAGRRVAESELSFVRSSYE